MTELRCVQCEAIIEGEHCEDCLIEAANGMTIDNGPLPKWRPKKTHCVNGHEMTIANTYMREHKNGHQQAVCKLCIVEYGKRLNVRMAQKTHCRNGHELTPENSRKSISASGNISRRCLECSRVSWKARRENKT